MSQNQSDGIQHKEVQPLLMSTFSSISQFFSMAGFASYTQEHHVLYILTFEFGLTPQHPCSLELLLAMNKFNFNSKLQLPTMET